MITIDGVLSMLEGAGTDAEMTTVRTLAIRSGLAWECGNCQWLNPITDSRCYGDSTDACTERPTVHLGSATTVHPDGDRTRFHTLAMCGADLGPMGEYTGPDGNTMRPECTRYAAVTCTPCRNAFDARR